MPSRPHLYPVGELVTTYYMSQYRNGIITDHGAVDRHDKDYNEYAVYLQDLERTLYFSEYAIDPLEEW